MEKQQTTNAQYDQDLKGKVAIVTGGGRDIGRAVSLQLARLGVRVVINYLHGESAAAATLQQIEKEGGEAIIVKGDVTLQADVQNIVQQTQDKFGAEIHLLVNVAGGLIARKTLTEMDVAFWNQVIDLNLTSVFLMCQAVVPLMPAGGSIVNFSSQAGRDGGGPGAAVYATAKGGVMTYTRALAKELGPQQIRVNSVLPGMIATTFHDTFTKDEVRTNVARTTPLRREGRSEDVAELVVYLCSSAAAFVTGANFDINGGTYFS